MQELQSPSMVKDVQIDSHLSRFQVRDSGSYQAFSNEVKAASRNTGQDEEHHLPVGGKEPKKDAQGLQICQADVLVLWHQPPVVLQHVFKGGSACSCIFVTP